MSSIGEDRVRDRDEGFIECRRYRHANGAPWLRVEAGSNHAYNPSNGDAKDARYADPAQPVQCPRQATQQRRDGEDARVQHQAQLIVAQTRERNLSREQLPSRREDGEHHCPERQQLSPERPKEDVARVAHVVYLGMPHLELHQQPGSVGREHSQEDDDDQTWHDTDDGERGRQGEHAIADDLRDHEHGDELP